MKHNQRFQFKDAKQECLRLKDFAGEVRLKEKDGKQSVKVQIMRVGGWEHPWYGAMLITPNTLSDMVNNFKNNVRRQDLAADYFHESEREAAAWFTDLYIENNGQELWADMAPTPKLLKMLADKEVRYFSADFYFEWTDPETGVSYKNVLNGGGFVNRPFIKGMEPVTELSEGEKMLNLEEAKKEVAKLSEQITAKDVEIKTLAESVKVKDGEIATLKADAAKAAKEKEIAEKKAKFSELCAKGKACAAQEEAYMSNDMVKFAELAQPLNPAAAGGEGGGKTEVKELSDEEKAACKALGLSEEDFRKYNPVKI